MDLILDIFNRPNIVPDDFPDAFPDTFSSPEVAPEASIVTSPFFKACWAAVVIGGLTAVTVSLGVGALVAYGVIGSVYFYSVAKDCYSSNKNVVAILNILLYGY